MNAVIEDKLPDMRALCAKHRVRRLSVFGSVLTGRFDPATSDIDMIVEFAPMDPVDHANEYFGLLQDLERVFGMAVDLIEREAIENPYFQRAVERSETVLYHVV